MIKYFKNLLRRWFEKKPEAVTAFGNLYTKNAQMLTTIRREHLSINSKRDILPVNYERIILEKAVKAFNLKKLSV